MLGIHSPLTARLCAHVQLTSEEKNLLNGITSKTVRTAAARRDIIREGDTPRSIKVILDGWAMRYKQLPDGRRQILAFLIPGDVAGNALVHQPIEHSIAALTTLRYAEVAQTDLEALVEWSPRISKALWWTTLVTVSTQRQWTTNVGRRHAYERIAHLLCEVFARVHAVGLTRGDSCEFPLTQIDIAEATGVTPVHVNRMIRALRHEELIELREKRLTIRNPARLGEVAMFDAAYLHLHEPVSADPFRTVSAEACARTSQTAPAGL